MIFGLNFDSLIPVMLRNTAFTRDSRIIVMGLLLLFTVLLTESCSRKSGCPAEEAQTQVDKRGQYKPGKSTSGLGLVPKKAKKKSKSR